MTLKGTAAWSPLVRWLIISMLMLVAFALRVYAIADTPPGLTHDEVASLEVSSRIQHGDWRVFYGEDYGVEPAYYYVLALFRTIFGDNMLAWRLPAVVGGLLGLAAIYVLTVRLFGRGVGLIALAVAAVTWWSVIMSRVILREMWEVFWYALAIYGFWRGFEPAVQSTQTARLRPMIFGGIALGVAQYVHTIPRGLFGVFVLFGFYLVFFHRSVFKRSWRGIVALIIFAELIAIPVLVTDTSVGTSVFQTADETPVVSHLLAATERYIGQFFWQGDAAWEFNVPLRPIFDPLGALFLGLGLLIILARISRPTHALTFFAWAVTLVPGILFDAHYPFPRSVTAQVTTFALVGLGVQASVRGLERIRLPRAQAIAVLTIGAWLIWNVARTGYDMFSIWPTVGDVRSGYHMEQRDLGRYLATHSSILPVSQCTLWVIFPGDPQYHQSIPHEAAAYFMPNTTDIRWHDCRYSLVIPAGGQFIFAHPDLEPLESFLGRGLKKPWLDNAQPVPGVSGALQVDARTALQNQLAEWQTLPIGWPPEASITTTAALPIDFNHAVELLGYQIKPPLVKPGATVRVITYWRVIGDLPSDLIAFTHLYRTPSEVVAQQDQLDVDGSSLHPGDVFMQSHEFIVVPADSSAGAYTIGVGLYRKGTGDRWPIYVGAQRVADRLFLDQIQVKP